VHTIDNLILSAKTTVFWPLANKLGEKQKKPNLFSWPTTIALCIFVLDESENCAQQFATLAPKKTPATC
jgi:hypothetical protein